MQNIVEEESKLKNFLYSKNELDVSEEKMPSVIEIAVLRWYVQLFSKKSYLLLRKDPCRSWLRDLLKFRRFLINYLGVQSSVKVW
jgi:hypothetical protein